MDKFKMELTWHNCKDCPPSEFENNALVITDGHDVFGVSWHRERGYFVSYDDGDMELYSGAWKNWWWADLEQTVRETSEFDEVLEI
jgi:hypothetical protein